MINQPIQLRAFAALGAGARHAHLRRRAGAHPGQHAARLQHADAAPRCCLRLALCGGARRLRGAHQLLAPRVRLADRAAEPAALAAHLGERGEAPRRGEVEEGRAAQRGGGVAARGRGDGGDRGARGVNIFVYELRDSR